MADLITLDTYKQAKAISSTKDDTRLEFLIPAVSQLVKTYCGNSFVDYTGSEAPMIEYLTVDWQTNILQLTEGPLISVVSVSERPDYSYSYYVSLQNTEYMVNPRTDTIIRRLGYWPIGVESVEVIYTAGYTTVPADLQLAVIDLVAYYFKDEYKVSRVMSGASINNPVTSMAGSISFPDHIKRVLDFYRYI